MRNGIYRMRYQTTTLCTTAVVVLSDGILSGCDRFHFMFGDYHHHGNTLTGTVTFKRHTEHPGHDIPDQFKLVFDGIASDNFGQLDVHCPDVPQICGCACFTWMAGIAPASPEAPA